MKFIKGQGDKYLWWFKNKYSIMPNKFRGFPHETWEAVLNTNHQLELTNFLLTIILMLQALIAYKVYG